MAPVLVRRASRGWRGGRVTINEDDGPGRAAFMTWFGDVQIKRGDTVGGLIPGE